MPNFKSTTYYQPRVPAYHLKNFQASQQNLIAAEEKYKHALAAIQTELVEIVNDLILQFDSHPFKETAIFDRGLHTENSYPLKKYKPKLNSLLANKIHPASVIQILETCIRDYTGNMLDPDFDRFFELKIQNQPTVDRAHRMGRELQKEFAQSINKLKKLQALVEPYQQAIDQVKIDIKNNNPNLLYIQILNAALIAALQAIKEEANNLANTKKDMEAGGIRGFCEELLKKPNQDLDPLIEEYTTLRNRAPNGYADIKLKEIKAIFAAHHANQQLVEQGLEITAEDNASDKSRRSNPSTGSESDLGTTSESDLSTTSGSDLSTTSGSDLSTNSGSYESSTSSGSDTSTSSASSGRRTAAPTLNATEIKKQRAIQELKTLVNGYLADREKYKNKGEVDEVKEYFYPYPLLTFFQKSYSQKKAAIKCLFDGLDGRAVGFDESDVSTLRDGNLGKTLRGFVKSGKADAIVGQKVSTIREFLGCLATQPSNLSQPR